MKQACPGPLAEFALSWATYSTCSPAPTKGKLKNTCKFLQCRMSLAEMVIAVVITHKFLSCWKLFTMHFCFTYKPVVWAHSTVNHTNTFCHHLYLEVYDKVICDLSLHFVIQNNLHTYIIIIHEQWLKEV